MKLSEEEGRTPPLARRGLNRNFVQHFARSCVTVIRQNLPPAPGAFPYAKWSSSGDSVFDSEELFYPSYATPIADADRAVVFVLAQDTVLRSHICAMASAAGLNAQSFSTAAQFLADYSPGRLGCLIFEWELPDTPGFMLQSQLVDRRIDLPQLILAKHATTRMAVQAIRGGACEFWNTPVDDDRLKFGILGAIERQRSVRRQQSHSEECRKTFKRLTLREQQVFWHVVIGRPNKSTARHLQISEGSVETYRTRLMKKLGAKALGDLIQISMLFDE